MRDRALRIASKALKDHREFKVRPGRKAILDPLVRKVQWVFLALWGLLAKLDPRVPKALRGRKVRREQRDPKDSRVLTASKGPQVQLERLGRKDPLVLPDPD